ncbi:hypothetical protein FLJC2902T_31180 [Flavobacterium limnosediminis JC2902]|uniref:Signal transduction histidine kinase internal region domain-containing protein n=2 Tax=Flavobacterium TaxID=237 RepID=V6SLN7_9FLAO|nr:hypothetical protein FLJC2902T_31180 [Flavobacterium limnosediminis JC2902]
MSLLRKFLILALLPLIIILVIILLTNSGPSEIKNTHATVFSIFFFAIVSFNAVYVSNFFNERKFSFIKKFFLTGLLSFLSVFVFAGFCQFYFKPDVNLLVALSQAVMGFCIFLLEYLVLFILNRKSDSLIKFEDKKWQYFILVMVVILIEFVLYMLMSFSSLRSFEDFTGSLWANRFMLTCLFLMPVFSLSLIRFSVRLRFNAVLTILFSSVFSTLITFLIIAISASTISKINIHYGAMLVVYLIGLFCSLSIYAFLYYRTQLKEKAKLKYTVKQKDAQYLELKNQVNPHFLFNNLNTLISFIESNPKKAIEFGHHLSSVYRHYLKKQEDDFVLVNEELDFIEEYLAIYKAKFEKGINYTITKDASNKLYVVSNCLQELIDNIFKHNVSDNENILEISIKAEDDSLITRNSIIKNNNAIANGFGLENIRKRYSHLTENEVKIKEDSRFFSVELPLFKME